MPRPARLTSRSPSRAFTVSVAGARQGRELATRERPLGHEQERLELRLGQVVAGQAVRRSAAVAGARPSPGPSPASTSARRRPRPTGLRRSASMARCSSLTRPPRGGSRRRAAADGTGHRSHDDGPPRRVLLDRHLAPLHELEHREERDRHDDPVAHAGEKLLEDDRAGLGDRRPDEGGPLGERDRARDGLDRRRHRAAPPWRGGRARRRGARGPGAAAGARPPRATGGQGHGGLAPDEDAPAAGARVGGAWRHRGRRGRRGAAPEAPPRDPARRRAGSRARAAAAGAPGS